MEIDAEVLIKATKVDGVYDKDPKTNPDAKRFDRLTYIEALNMRVGVMDSTALTLCMDNDLPIIVLDLWQPDSLEQAVSGRAGRHARRTHKLRRHDGSQISQSASRIGMSEIASEGRHAQGILHDAGSAWRRPSRRCRSTCAPSAPAAPRRRWSSGSRSTTTARPRR